MSLVRTTLPASEPIILEEAKLHLRDTHPAEDALITKLIKAARMDCEHKLQRTLITSGWTLKLNSFSDLDYLPMPNLLSVVSVSYFDSDNVLQVINSADYRVSGVGSYGYLTPVESWPAVYKRHESVSIVYTAGYGAADDVPEPIKQWILFAIGDMYMSRERSSDRPVVTQHFADSLLEPYKVWA